MPHPPGLTAFEDGTEGPRYLPASDQVRIPQQLRRLNPESWYNAVFHQLVHSTGHPARLGRFELDQPASDRAPIRTGEELAAAMGAGLLASRAGIGSRALDLRASFFRDWREAIDRDKPDGDPGRGYGPEGGGPHSQGEAAGIPAPRRLTPGDEVSCGTPFRAGVQSGVQALEQAGLISPGEAPPSYPGTS